MKRFLLAVAIISLSLSPQITMAQIGGPTVVSAVFGDIEKLIATLRENAQDLLSQGNAVASQQLTAIAAILDNTLKRMESSYESSMNKTFDRLTDTEKQAFNNLHDLAKSVADFRTDTVADVSKLIYQSQAAANQLLRNLPFNSQFPAYYGLQTRDAALAVDGHEFDIEILGFNLTDPRLGYKKPIIIVEGYTIPEDRIAAQEDRVRVQLPDQIRRTLNPSGSPCLPKPAFRVGITSFYRGPVLSLGLFDINGEKEAVFTGFGLATQTQFDTLITYNATQNGQSVQYGTFSVTSGSVNVACERSGSANISYTAPGAGAVVTNAVAQWISMSNIKANNAQQTIAGNTASGSGTIAGRNYDRFPFGVKNCPGGGHGTLQLTGTYTHQNPTTATLQNQPLPMTGVLRQGKANSITLPLPKGVGLVVSNVTATLKRRGCDQVFDTATVPVPTGGAAAAEVTGVNGHLRFAIVNDQMRLSVGGP